MKLESLQKALLKMQEMENYFLAHKSFLKKDIEDLASLLKEFQKSPRVDLQKIAQIPNHLHTDMELRFFINMMVPIERALERNLRDDQFIVLSEDRKTSAHPKAPMVFLLENIRSAFNVGSIFRLADCLHITEIGLIGYTLSPESEQLQKTSLGATANIAWRSFSKTKEAVDQYRQQGYEIVGLETAEKAEDLFTAQFQKPTAFLVGNERFGLEINSLELCDRIVSIPTFGIKNSLNVSQALSIASYEWRRQQS